MINADKVLWSEDSRLGF